MPSSLFAFAGRGALALAVAFLTLPAAGPSGAAGRAAGPLAPERGVLFGAHVQRADGLDPFSSVLALEERVGRRFAIDHYYKPFAVSFPDDREPWDYRAGRIPMVSWGKAPSAEVNGGAHDDVIRTRARALRGLGQPVMVRWFWEMAAKRNAPAAGSPADYVKAWRRVHGIFEAEGATNVVWVWCPDASDFVPGPDGRRVAESFYPGDDTVDWVCADGYNFRHPARRGTDPRSFADTFAAFYDWAVASGKPIMIGETGVVEDGPGAKPAWVDATREALKSRLPAVAAFVYFHSVGDHKGVTYDWRMDTSESARAAFAAMGADPWFRPVVAATLPDTRISEAPNGTVANPTATVTFTAADPYDPDNAAAGFECSLDGGAFAACTSPANLDTTGDGKHTFSVRAVGRIGLADPTPAATSWAVDTTPPEVTAVRPAAGDTAVATNTVVTIAFSEPIDPARLGPGAFTLVHELTGRSVPGELSYDAPSRTVVFTPSEELLGGFAYQARLAGQTAADRVGNVMAAEVAWSFTTAGLDLSP